MTLKMTLHFFSDLSNFFLIPSFPGHEGTLTMGPIIHHTVMS